MIGKIMILSAFVVLGFVDCCLMVSASRYDRKQTEKTGGFYCEQNSISRSTAALVRELDAMLIRIRTRY